ncbi:protease, partial [Streptomyces sp. ID01-9D]|nr:protease [Streptomyces sp. ID01-9D]
MDDGKPTGPQAKWWSRPSAAGPAAEDRTPAAEDREPVAEDRGPAVEDREPAARSQIPAPVPAQPSDGSGRPDEHGREVPGPRPSGQPLHEPDEYSTPPYGGPGPWAPAPPVQRPTPAHGTVVPPGAGGPPPQYAAPNAAG